MRSASAIAFMSLCLGVPASVESPVAAPGRLPAHPEGFQIDPARNRIYVNLPTADQIGVVDASSEKVIARWGPWLAVGNFPMALDEAGDRLFSGYGWPASIVAINTASGDELANVSACGVTGAYLHDRPKPKRHADKGDESAAQHFAITLERAEVHALQARPRVDGLKRASFSTFLFTSADTVEARYSRAGGGSSL